MFLSLYSTRARIHKMHVRKANREDPEQTDLDVPCLSMPFCLFVLLFYVPSQQLWSLRDGQFT